MLWFPGSVMRFVNLDSSALKDAVVPRLCDAFCLAELL